MTLIGQVGAVASQTGQVVPGYGSVLAQPAATSDPGDQTASANKFYFQNRLHPNAIYPANGDLSAALPKAGRGFAAQSGDTYESLYLSPVKGTAQAVSTVNSVAQTGSQDNYYARFISDFLQPQTIAAFT